MGLDDLGLLCLGRVGLLHLLHLLYLLQDLLPHRRLLLLLLSVIMPESE